MSLEMTQKTNRVPTPRERSEIQQLLKRDEEELTRLTEYLKLLEKKATGQHGTILNYKQALDITESMRRITERTRKTMSGNGKILQIHDDDTSVKDLGEVYSHQKYQNILQEAQITKQAAVAQAKKAADKIAELDTTINDIKQEITAEESILSVIKLSEQNTLASIQRLKDVIALKVSIISARRIVPIEIWRHIFSFRVSEDEKLFQEGKREGLPPFTPLKLSAVCRYWRSIVVTYPALWQQIPIPHHDHISSSQRDCITHYSTRCAPLRAKAYTYSNDRVGFSFTIQLAPFLGQTIERYQTLEIFNRKLSVTRNSSLSDFLRSLSPKADMLRIIGDYETSFQNSVISVGSICDVKHLIVTGQAIGLSDHTIDYFRGLSTATALQTFENLSLDTSSFASSLVYARSLECLSMVNVALRFGTLTTCIKLPALKRLACDFNIYPHISRLIHAPRLQDLTLAIKSTVGDPRNSFQWLGHSDKNHTVCSLTLHASIEESNGQMLGAWIIDHFSKVVALHLDGTTATSKFLAPLALAHMQVLTISNSTITEDKLASSMHRFAALHQRIPRLVILNCVRLDMKAIERLQNRDYLAMDMIDTE